MANRRRKRELKQREEMRKRALIRSNAEWKKKNVHEKGVENGSTIEQTSVSKRCMEDKKKENENEECNVKAIPIENKTTNEKEEIW